MSEPPQSGVNLTRRSALALGLTAVGSVAAGFAIRESRAAPTAILRPPGAIDETRFLAACIRCFQCGEVCPNQAIQFGGLQDGLARAYTPVIRAREQSCILCMKCTTACPTDALTPIADDPDTILNTVRMGTAHVDQDLCYSHNDRICGVCYYACPFPDQALRLETNATPYVDEKFCVGCGNCERACIHLPHAIRITPRERAA
jgi:ferredoxin-type protein NapG